MVDTPKENNGEEQKDATEDNPLEKQPKRQRRHRSKTRLGKNSDNNARKNNTPVDADDNEDPADPAMEQDEQGDDEHSPGPLSDHNDAEDTNHQPVSKEEINLDDDAFIIPEKQLEQERLH